jgi:two-component sensor histidine kinase
LSFRQRQVNFEFSALDFTNPSNNRYQYKLENFDQDWVDIGHRHDVGFTNLPSGQYLLRISGANSNGVWNNDGIRLPINVYPPPWSRWWAFSLYGALLMAVATLIRKYYDTYLMKEQATELAADLHNTAELVMDDLEDQLEMEQQLVLNIHNHAISTLKLVAGLLERQADSIDDDVILDAFTDNQQRLACLQLIEDNMIYTVHLLEVDFYKFLEDLYAQLFPLQIRPELEVVPINDALNQKLESDIAIPAALITNELVVNSARHAFETATGIQTVRVKLHETEALDGWILEVADSGSGLPPGIDPRNPTTMGMDIVARLSRQLNARITVDLSKGSLFRFEIPRTRPDHSRS